MEDRVDLNDVIEWYLAAPITVRDVPQLEAAIPGFADALSAWINMSPTRRNNAPTLDAPQRSHLPLPIAPARQEVTLTVG